MMRFDMTFDDALRDGSSFGECIKFNFDFYCYCLSLKANFQKKNICGNTCTRGFLGLLNQVLAFVTFFS